MSVKITADLSSIMNKIEPASKKTAFALGMELKENLRSFMHRDTEAMLRSVQNPIPIYEGDKVGIRISINKEYAQYQDKAVLQHRAGYQEGDTRKSSFRYAKDKSLEDRIKETADSMQDLNPKSKLYQQKQNTIENFRNRSKSAYDYSRGYRRETGQIKGVSPVGGIVKERANFVSKAIKKTLINLKKRFEEYFRV